MKRIALSAFAASLILGGASFAYAQQNTATTVGAGSAEANRNGAQAGAVSAGQAQYGNQGQQRGRRNNQQGGQHQGHNMGGQQTALPNSASTYTTGAVYTDRNRATASGSTGGAAAGSGTQTTSSGLTVSGDVFTGPDGGGSAVVDGGSTAQSRERRQR